MEMIYTKVSRTRLPKYQILTSIVRENGTVKVLKKALYAEGREHLQRIVNNKRVLFNKMPSMILPEVSWKNADTIEFDFFPHESLESRMFEYVLTKNKEEILRLFRTYVQFVQEHSTVFCEQKDFPDFEVKDPELEGTRKTVVNLDLNFDNILIGAEGKYEIVDYEWIFYAAIPWKFIVYRAVLYFFVRHSEFLNFMEIDDFFRHAGILHQEVKLFQRIEQAFSKYVHGDGYDYFAKPRYLKENQWLFPYLEQLKSSLGEAHLSIREKEDWILQKEGLIRAKDEYIGQLENRLHEALEETNRLQVGLEETRQSLNHTTDALKDSNKALDAANERLNHILMSRSWKLAQRMSKIYFLFKKKP